jgi:hypothetical protein
VKVRSGAVYGRHLLWIVIPNEVRDLHLAADCRSLTSFGMTKSDELKVEEARSLLFIVDGISLNAIPWRR